MSNMPIHNTENSRRDDALSQEVAPLLRPQEQATQNGSGKCEMKDCPNCGPLPLSEFYPRYDLPGKYHAPCRTCHKKRVAEAQVIRRRLIRERELNFAEICRKRRAATFI